VQELKDLFHRVRGFSTSCRMDKEQTELYKELNKLYNELSGSNITHSVCSKNNLLIKIEYFIKCNQ